MWKYLLCFLFSISLLAQSFSVNSAEYIEESPLVIEHTPIPLYVEPQYREVVVELTAYTASPEENGGNDTGITASGEPIREGYIAADDLEFGTRVIIDGKEYVVADRFGGGYRNRMDIFMTSRGDAYRFGRQTKVVKIIEE